MKGGDKLILWAVESLDNPDDRALIGKIYTDFSRLMYATASKYVSSLPDQEDIIHNAVLKLIRRIETLRKVHCCALASYIVYTVRSVSIDFLRVQGRLAGRTVSLDGDIDNIAESTEGSLDVYMISRERLSKLADIWPKLPEEDRLLLEGKYIWGCTDKELAKDLHCKPDSIRMKLTRARRRAFNCLSEREKV